MNIIVLVVSRAFRLMPYCCQDLRGKFSPVAAQKHVMGDFL
jgi:hypothetical protein